MPHTGCLIRDAQPSPQPEALGGRKLPNSQGLQHHASLNLKNPGWLTKTSEISLVSPLLLLLLLLEYFYALSRQLPGCGLEFLLCVLWTASQGSSLHAAYTYRRYSWFRAEPRVSQTCSFKALSSEGMRAHPSMWSLRFRM